MPFFGRAKDFITAFMSISLGVRLLLGTLLAALGSSTLIGFLAELGAVNYDPRLHFNEGGSLLNRNDRWDLPTGYIVGMSLAVVVAPENANEVVDAKLGFNLFGEQHQLNSLWGARSKVRAAIAARFKDPHLFEC